MCNGTKWTTYYRLEKDKKDLKRELDDMQSQLQHVIKQKVIAEWLFHSLVILQAVCSLTLTLGLGARAWEHLTLLLKKKTQNKNTTILHQYHDSLST